MKTSRQQVICTALEEAIVTVAYPDGEKMSIGVGHNDPALKPGDEWDLPRIFDQFARDLEVREKDITRWLHVPVTQSEFDPLIDIYFNKGNQVHPVIDFVNDGNKLNAVAQMLTINRDQHGVFKPGLAERRYRNMRVFLHADYGDLSAKVKIYRGDPKLVKPKFIDFPAL